MLIAIQSLRLYSAVARLPVALALLAFNTYPLWTALARVVYAHRPERRVLMAMPVMLVGLALALDVFGAASGRCGRAGAASAPAWPSRSAPRRPFGLPLVFTQHEAGDLDGRGAPPPPWAVALLALAGVAVQGGFHLPQ